MNSNYVSPFPIGTLLRRGHLILQVLDVLPDGHVLLRNCASMERASIEPGKLNDSVEARRLVACATPPRCIPTDELLAGAKSVAVALNRPMLSLCSPAAQGRTIVMLELMDRLHAIGHRSLRPSLRIELDLNRIWREVEPLVATIRRDLNIVIACPSAHTLYEWDRKRRRTGGSIVEMIPRYHDRGGRGESRLDDVAERHLQSVVAEIRSDQGSKIVVRDVMEEANRRTLAETGVSITTARLISKSTAARRLNEEFSPYERALRNFGPDDANEKYRQHFGKERASAPLLLSQYDDKDSRVYLLSQRTELPAGRAWVTPGLDEYSESCMGWNISARPRSAQSAIAALVHSILPKNPDHPDYAGVTNALDRHGRCAVALFDNFLGNHAAQIYSASRDVGVTPAWTRPKTPTDKFLIEKFNATADREFFSKQPGYAGPKRRRAHAKGIEQAAMYDSEFRAQWAKWVFNVYHRMTGADGFTPDDRWRLLHPYFRPLVPSNLPQTEILLTQPGTARHTPLGAIFRALPYQSEQFVKFSSTVRNHSQLEIRFNTENLVRIWIHDHRERRLLAVPIQEKWREYATGLSLFAHELIRGLIEEKRRRHPDLPDLWEARMKLRAETKALSASTKLRKRQQAERQSDPDTPPPPNLVSSSPPADDEELVTDLERYVDDISQIPPRTEDEEWIPRM